MPIRVLDKLPAVKFLRNENIYIMQKSKDTFCNLHSLKILILNLMPKKIETENQLLRLLSYSPLYIDIYLLRIDQHITKNTPVEHLNNFYCTFKDIEDQKFDGLIVTGAPLGLIDFINVNFWSKIQELFLWAITNVTSILFICWGVQAGLKILYNVPKFVRKKKLVGIYQHHITYPYIPLTKGFDDIFNVPHSRYSDFPKNIIYYHTDLEIVSESDEAGIYLLINQKKRLVFVTGHPEYDTLTLSEEYYRDLKLGIPSTIPDHYFPHNNPNLIPKITWRSHAYLLFSNWIHYYVHSI